MRKTSKFFVMTVATLMIASFIMVAFSNVSFAAKENVTVEITPDDDGSMTLSEDKKTLVYEYDEENKFQICLQDNKTTTLTLERKTTKDAEGHDHDTYFIEGLSSNENLYLKCNNFDSNKIFIRYSGSQIEFNEDYSQSLDKIDDVNHYSFRVEKNYANNNGNENNNNENIDVSYFVDFGQAEWTVDGKKVTAAIWGQDELKNGPIVIGKEDSIKLGGFDSSTMQIKLVAKDGFTAFLKLLENSSDETAIKTFEGNLPGTDSSNPLTFIIEKKSNNGNQPEDNQGPVGGEDDIAMDVNYTGTHVMVWINGKNVKGEEDYSFEGIIEKAGTKDSSKTNVIRLQEMFGDLYVTKHVINGVEYTKDSDNVVIDETGWKITVPGAEKYTIRGEGDKSIAVPRTIIWANVDANKNAEDYAEDMVLEHGSAKIVAVYNEKGEKTSGELEADKDGFGYAVVAPGSKVVFEFVPEYGYQLTSVKANGFALEPQETINQYTFTMPDTNVHFAAEFTKTEDVVKAASEKVSSGKIELGDSLTGGSAQLTVNDVKLDEDKIKNFEKAAGEYEIANYLDIDLYQVFYKGKKDSEDVWTNKIDELDKEAVISIKLEENVDAKDIVIVHNIHNGDKYEIIKIDSYDKETNTITFKTSSFSNYAIATKEVAEKQEMKLTDTKTNITIEFEGENGLESKDYSFEILDVSNLTEEELKEFNITKEEYESIRNKIVENCNKIGTFVKVYNIQLSIPEDGKEIHDGPFKVRIPYTEDLKKFDEFKLAYIDDEKFTVEETIDLTVEGDYLVGTLKHLSQYALIGKVTEKSEVKTNNPITEDNIIIFTSIFTLSTLAVVFETIFIKKSKFSK